MRQVAGLNLAEAWKAIDTSVLVIYGTSDFLTLLDFIRPNGRHNLIEVPPDNPNECVRLKRFPPGLFETMVDWTTAQLRRRAPASR